MKKSNTPRAKPVEMPNHKEDYRFADDKASIQDKTGEASIIENVEKNQIKRNRFDVENRLNPLFSITIGSPYESREMLRDVEELLIAASVTGAREAMKEMLEAVEKMDEEWEQKIIEHCDFVLEEMVSQEYAQGFADMEKVILKGFENRKIKLGEMKEELGK